MADQSVQPTDGGQEQRPPVAQSPLPDRVEWDAPEFIHYERGSRWTLLLWLAAVALSALLVWNGGITFFGILAGLVPLAAAFALTSQSRHKPRVLHNVIDDEGVHFGTELHSWAELKSFWIVFTDDRQSLYLETTRRLLPYVTIELADVDPESVRATLLKRLPEHAGRQEDLNDRVSRFLRF